MTLDLGDEAFAGAATSVPLPSDTDFSAGDAVVWNASNDEVEQSDSSGENVMGIAAEDAPSSSGDVASIWISGPVVASAGGSVVQGDVVVTGSTAGRLDQNSDSTGMSTDVDGTSDQGVFAPANPIALTDSGGTFYYNEGNSLGTNEAVVYLK